MSKLKITLLSILSIIFLFALIWGLSYHEIIFMRFFKPRRENVNRKVFEETKAYVHGKTQDLAKYYEEYQKAKSPENKQIIKNVIKMRFAEFNSENLNNYQLKQFLISVRGY